MITSKELGKDHDKYHKKSCSCGESIFRQLPTFVCETLTCQCEKDYRENIGFMGEIPGAGFGVYCLDCGRPSRFSVANNHWACEGCGQLFTYDFREITEIPKVKLCRKCDSNVVPLATSRGRITRISFH